MDDITYINNLFKIIKYKKIFQIVRQRDTTATRFPLCQTPSVSRCKRPADFMQCQKKTPNTLYEGALLVWAICSGCSLN